MLIPSGVIVAREIVARDVSTRQAAAQLGVDASTLRYHFGRPVDAGGMTNQWTSRASRHTLFPHPAKERNVEDYILDVAAAALRKTLYEARDLRRILDEIEKRRLENERKRRVDAGGS